MDSASACTQDGPDNDAEGVGIILWWTGVRQLPRRVEHHIWPNTLSLKSSRARQASQRLVLCCVKVALAMMEALPTEVQCAICQDALLMHVHARQQHQWNQWMQPLFALWAKIVHYERLWPGSASEAGSIALV